MQHLSQNQKNIALTAFITAVIMLQLFYIITLKKEIEILEERECEELNNESIWDQLQEKKDNFEIPNFEDIL